jgi:methylmalonyl-CoA/ethylmalonyl-CoA epimerase
MPGDATRVWGCFRFVRVAANVCNMQKILWRRYVAVLNLACRIEAYRIEAYRIKVASRRRNVSFRIMRLEHIGIAVSDIAAARAAFTALLGAEPYKVERVESENLDTHFLWAGGAKIELLHATHEDSVITKFIKKRGEGLHHLAFSVHDLAEAARSLESSGFEIIGNGPKPGADGKRIFFIHPKNAHGVLIECCERTTSGPIPVDTEIFNGLEITRFGSSARSSIALVFERNQIESQNSLCQLVDRFEPTHQVVRIVTPAGTGDLTGSRILSDLEGILVAAISSGPDTLMAAHQIATRYPNPEFQWIHIALPDKPVLGDNVAQRDNVDLADSLSSANNLAGITPFAADVTHVILPNDASDQSADNTLRASKLEDQVSYSVLPSAAINPADPEIDALVPLIKSLLSS